MNFDAILTPPVRLLIDVLAAGRHETRVIGGAPRNLLLGVPPSDIDLCTTALPGDVMRILRERCIRTVPTGLSHGTVLAVIDGVGYEITTLRADIETDGRHASVQFLTSFSEDASRRDFTMNAMSVAVLSDGSGRLHDYFRGREDLLSGRIRFVGEARRRISEDYLRCLRLYRFAGQFGLSIDEQDREAVRKSLGGLSCVSGERFWQEMSKLVVSAHGGVNLRRMIEDGVAQAIGLGSESLLDRSAVLDSIAASTAAGIPFGVSPAGVIGFWLDGEDSVHILRERWKWSNDDHAEALFTQRHRDKVSRPLDYFEDLLVEGVNHRWVARLLGMAGRTAEASRLADWNIPSMPVKGRDLLAAGIEPGRHIGPLLDEMKRRWIASRFRAGAGDLIAEVLPDAVLPDSPAP